MALPIKSMLDDDLYKFNMQNVVLEHYPDADAVYRFKNRRPADRFGRGVVDLIRQNVDQMADLRLTDSENKWLGTDLTWFTPQYRDYLRNYRFNPDEVKIDYIEDAADNQADMEIEIAGKWHSAIRWEVPLMAIISQNFFQVDSRSTNWTMDGQAGRVVRKGSILQENLCTWADFGTRRRRCYEMQDMIVGGMKVYDNFVGTSNVHFAMKHGVKAIGTQAHELYMAISVLESLRHANRFTMERWLETYHGELGIALTDTFGTNSFFKDFGSKLARLFDGVRHDSGDPFEFGNKVIEHYKSLRIDPMTKTIVFSDGLDVELATKIAAYFKGKIRVSFGIGTHFTNDWTWSNDLDKALNMVIKLFSINGIPVAKLSDDLGKSTGEEQAVRIARHIHFGTHL